MVTFGQLMREAREGLGIVQITVANETGINKAMISQYENDISIPSLPVALKLAKYLGISLDDLRETVSIPADWAREGKQ
jgi:transcriptional regulator with XRE-family HTH domain